MNDKKDDLTFKELRELDNANSKDAKMNTPNKIDESLSIMPHDQETLKTFNLKEMNFKDMTNAQKNTFIIIIALVILLMVIIVTPVIKKMFGGVTIGNLRFKTEEKVEEESKSYAYAGDLIIIGNNTSIVVENIKFNNFTKGSNYTGLFNYVAQEDISDVSSLKIYIEYYNYSKTLLKRFKFDVEKNELKKDEEGTVENILSENSFKKAHYVTVRVMSDAELIEVPDPEDPGEEGENVTDPENKENKTKQKNNSNELKCNKISVDSDVRINEFFFIEFENNKLKQYSVEYKISKISPKSDIKKYSSYYKKMLKRYRNAVESGAKDYSIEQSYEISLLKFKIVLDDYFSYTIAFNPTKEDLKNNPNIIDEFYESLEKKKKYKLEIDRKSDKSSAKEKMENNGFVCE